MIKWIKQLFANTGSGRRKTYEVGKEYPCYKDPDLPFEFLNQLQSCFRDKYNPNRNCVVDSGTGTGKTPVAYIASRYFLDNGQTVCMMAPTKELVKDIFRDAVSIWGRKITGLFTGHAKDTDGKYFIVATPEGYLSSLRSGREWAKNVGLLIVDEAHNILDPTRGGDLDVAITLHVEKGGKVLLMSGTFSNKEDMVKILDADLFVSKHSPTKYVVSEIHCQDDLDAAEAPKKPAAGVIVTMSGHAYNGISVRLQKLKDILAQQKNKSVLIFVPTKAIGYCLSESLLAPFHCADIDEQDKNRIVAEFNAGKLKTLIATTTLSQGVNTPTDTVIIFGTRCGSNYAHYDAVKQLIGRAGRRKAIAYAYIIGDKIELFHARKSVIVKSMPIPVESMALTVLTQKTASKTDICNMLAKTYAGSLSNGKAIMQSVDRCMGLLKACRILDEKPGGYSLTNEGFLLARYYISPTSYVKYVKTARKLKNLNDMTNEDKGCVLLSIVMPGNGFTYGCSHRIEKDFLMKLIPIEADKDLSAARAGLFKRYLQKPSLIPSFFKYQLKDAERWLSMLSDMEKYNVHKDGSPGKEHLHYIAIELKRAAASSEGSKKPKSIVLKLFDESSAQASINNIQKAA